MLRLFDSNTVIALRDNDPATLVRFEHIAPPYMISIITRVELENGVMRDPGKSLQRRAALGLLLGNFDIVDFGTAEADNYRDIVAKTGFNRSKTLDRMIAATALCVGATLVTANVRDFRDVPGLEIEDWSN